MDEQKQQTTEVRETTQSNAGGGTVRKQTVSVPDEQAQTAPGPVIAERIVYYLGGALALLLVIRFLLALFGANRDNPFASFIFDLSSVFVWPFFGLFNYEPSYGSSQVEFGTIIAIIVYLILTVGIAKLFSLTRRNA